MEERRPRALIFPLTFLMVTACSSTATKSSEDNLFPVQAGLQEPFPAPPAPTLQSAFRETGEIKKVNAIQTSNERFSFVKRIEQIPGNMRRVSVRIEDFQQTMNREGQSSELSGGEILRAEELSMMVDCQTRKVSDKKGFEESVERIEKQTLPAEQKDALIGVLVGLVAQAPEACGQGEWFFTVKQAEGKRPGTTWTQKVPMKELNSIEFPARFLGWHKENNQRYAVFYGRPQGKIDDFAPGVQANLDLKTYYLVSSDWKSMKKYSDTLTELSAPGEEKLAGTVSIRTTTERIE